MERSKIISGPAIEPVSLTRAKLHCRCQHTLEDESFHSWIKAARVRAEELTGKQLLTATWRQTLAEFPRNGKIVLEPLPVQSVVSIAYYDANGALQTLNAAEYQLVGDGDEFNAWVQPKPGGEWPATQSDNPNAVTVDFRAGYGDAAVSVPADFHEAMLLMVGQWYLHREKADLAAAETMLESKISRRCG